MDLLQNLNWTVVLVVLTGLCVVGILLLFVLQVLGGAFGFLFNIFEIVGNILGGGPIAWCGCLLVLGGCGACAVFVAIAASVLSTCGTPNEVNFCAFFGG